MANITYFPGNAGLLAPSNSFDITGVVAKRVGSMLNYYSFDTDGTMFVLHVQGVAAPGGVSVPTSIGWDHFDGATLLQSAAANLALQPFLDNMYSRHPSSIRAMNYFLGGDDQLTGSMGRDLMVAGAGKLQQPRRPFGGGFPGGVIGLTPASPPPPRPRFPALWPRSGRHPCLRRGTSTRGWPDR